MLSELPGKFVWQATPLPDLSVEEIADLLEELVQFRWRWSGNLLIDRRVSEHFQFCAK